MNQDLFTGKTVHKKQAPPQASVEIMRVAAYCLNQDLQDIED
ncbi:MAG: hypothetical protein ACK5F6_03935 [Bacteroidota bacterium]